MFFAAQWASQPKSMGVLHIIGIISAILFGIFGGIWAKRTKNGEKFLGLAGGALIVLEVLKVIFYLSVTGSYPLERIPFHICTVELFFLWAVPLVKNKKIKEAMVSFTLIGFMAACFYYVKPSTILNGKYIFMSFQSMIWHDIIIMVGVFSIVYFGIYGKKGKNYFINGYFLWLILTFLAVIIDVIVAKVNPASDINFFYLSPIQDGVTYPLLNVLMKQPKPYPLFIVAFIIYYSLGLCMVYGLITLIYKLKDKKKA